MVLCIITMDANHQHSPNCKRRRSNTQAKRNVMIIVKSNWWCVLFLLLFSLSNTPSTNDSLQRHSSFPPMAVATAANIPRTITIPKNNHQNKKPRSDANGNGSKSSRSRVTGLVSLFQQRPDLLLSVMIRIILAMALELVLDGFLKTVVTPALVATGIGAAVAPLVFLLEYTLQPMIHSVAFLIFDDRFLLATLEATGIKEDLVLSVQKQKSAKGTRKRRKGGRVEWHKISFMEGMFTRYVIKSCAAWCLAWAGLCTVIPVLGQILVAVLSGWIVAWDYVYVALSGMGYIGPWQQFQTVWQNFGQFHWYGFWAVLMEEIPFFGPSCHVYNVYSAAFFLEKVYIVHNKGDIVDDDTTAATFASEDSFNEL